MAAGKSTIGRLLSERLELPFVDSDTEIERAFGMIVAEIFRTSGEAEFREAEKGIIAGLLDGNPKVIAVGGGAFVDARTRETLVESTRTVWLDPGFDLILSRVAQSATRPLASACSDQELRQLWQERRACYAQAQLRIDGFEDDPRRTVDKIIGILGAEQA